MRTELPSETSLLPGQTSRRHSRTLSVHHTNAVHSRLQALWKLIVTRQICMPSADMLRGHSRRLVQRSVASRNETKWATGSCNFLTDSNKFLTVEIMVAQKFQFCPWICVKLGVFSLGQNFPDKWKIFQQFSDSGKKFRRGHLPPCHWQQ